MKQPTDILFLAARAEAAPIKEHKPVRTNCKAVSLFSGKSLLVSFDDRMQEK